MARKLIDISVPLQNDVPADPPGGHPTIQYIDHQQGLPRMLQFFDGKIAKWWTPDDVVFTDTIPLGATGKMQKNKLREMFKDHKLPTA